MNLSHGQLYISAALTEFLLGELEQLEQKKQANLARLRSERDELRANLSNLSVRPDQIRQELADVRVRRRQAQEALATTGETVTVVDAQQTAFAASRIAFTAQSRMLEQELVSSQVRLDLLEARAELAQRRLDVEEQALGDLQELINSKREADAAIAAAAALQASVAATKRGPTVEAVAQTNARLSEQLVEVVGRTTRLRTERGIVQRDRSQIRRCIEVIHRQLELAGGSPRLGQFLLAESRTL